MIDGDNDQSAILSGLGYYKKLLLDGTLAIEDPQATSTESKKQSRDDLVYGNALNECENLWDLRSQNFLKNKDDQFTEPTPAVLQNIDDIITQISPPKTLQQRLQEYKRKNMANNIEGESDGDDYSPSILSLNSEGKNSGSFLLSENSFLNSKNKNECLISKDIPSTGLIRDMGDLNVKGPKNPILKSHLPNFLMTASSFVETPNGKNTTNIWEKENENEESKNEAPVGLKLDFNAQDVSARSTDFHAEASRLLYGSNNSLGSFGNDGSESDESFPQPPSINNSVEEFCMDQTDIYAEFGGDDFNNIVDFDEEERKLNEENAFNLEDESFKSCRDVSVFSGIYDAREITVRPSWIESPDRDLIQSNNKIEVDTMFQIRSKKLGSLGDTSNLDERPSFGLNMKVRSPPGVPKHPESSGLEYNNKKNGYQLEDLPPFDFNEIASDKYINNNDPIETFKNIKRKNDSLEIFPVDVPAKDTNIGVIGQPNYNNNFLRNDNSGKLVEMTSQNQFDSSKHESSKVTSIIHDNLSKLDSTGFDTSLEVMSLRKKKEELLQKTEELFQKSKKALVLKEHNQNVINNQENMINQLGHCNHNFIKPPERTDKVNRPKMGVVSMTHRNIDANVDGKQQNKENLFSCPDNHKKITDEPGISIPNHIPLPKSCLVKLVKVLQLPIHNKRPKSIQVVISVKAETIDGIQVEDSNIFFNSNQNIGPNSRTDIEMYLCGHTKGLMNAVLSINFLQVDSNNIANVICTKHVTMSTYFEDLDILIFSENNSVVNYGKVPESCKVSRMITLVNKTNQYVPIRIKIIQDSCKYPAFKWGSNHLQKISATSLACELEPAFSAASPSAITIPLELKAPYLNNSADDWASMFTIENCKVQVILDVPDDRIIELASIPIQAEIAAVLLRLPKADSVLKLETCINEVYFHTFQLENVSKVPLTLSIKKNENDHIEVSPSEVTLQSNTFIDIKITYKPKKLEQVNSSVLIDVEPEGLELEVPVVAICKPTAPISNKPVHLTIQKSNSNPIPAITEKFSFRCNKERIVFGTEPIGDVVQQTMVIKNSWENSSVQLQFTIKGDQEFRISSSNPTEHYLQTIDLKPLEEYPVVIEFRPGDTKPYSALFICKPKGLLRSPKYSIPLQGFGGKGKLEISDLNEDQSLTIRDLSEQANSILKIPMMNRGCRTLCVKLDLFFDKKQLNPIPTHGIFVKPSEFLLKPFDTKEIVLYALGSPLILSRIDDVLGYLNVVYVDEIMRTRYRKIKARPKKVRKIKDKSLLTVNWDIDFGETKSIPVEEDNLPPQSEDAINFFNGCTKLQIALYGELSEGHDASTSTFKTFMEDTALNSVLDVTTDRSELNSLNISETSMKKSNQSLNDPKSKKSEGIIENDKFIIVPEKLTFNLSLNEFEEGFSVINISSTSQPYEVTCKVPWLSVTPKEGIVEIKKRTNFKVSLLKTQYLPTVKTDTHLQILFEDDCMTLPVTVKSNVKASKEKLIQQNIEHKSGPKMQKENKIAINQKETVARQIIKSNRENPVRETSSENESNQSIDVDDSLIDIEPTVVKFPPTTVGKEAAVKVFLKNKSPTLYNVKVSTTNKSFFIKHKQFDLMPGFFASVPIFFRPIKSGSHKSSVFFIIPSIDKIFEVQVLGQGC